MLEDFSLEDHKTKNFFGILKNLGVDQQQTLLVVKEHQANLTRASKNIPNSKIMRASDLNTYEIMRCKTLLFTEGGLKFFETGN